VTRRTKITLGVLVFFTLVVPVLPALVLWVWSGIVGG
jgi:hypothetical protein